jgi:hypothetical protein
LSVFLELADVLGDITSLFKTEEVFGCHFFEIVFAVEEGQGVDESIEGLEFFGGSTRVKALVKRSEPGKRGTFEIRAGIQDLGLFGGE